MWHLKIVTFLLAYRIFVDLLNGYISLTSVGFQAPHAGPYAWVYQWWLSDIGIGLIPSLSPFPCPLSLPVSPHLFFPSPHFSLSFFLIINNFPKAIQLITLKLSLLWFPQQFLSTCHIGQFLRKRHFAHIKLSFMQLYSRNYVNIYINHYMNFKVIEHIHVNLV